MCINITAMEQSLICKEVAQTNVKFLLKDVNKQVIHDATINRMNMVRETDMSKVVLVHELTKVNEGKTKVSGCFI
jgi:hypothetical protein